jgi:hypothetical protein
VSGAASAIPIDEATVVPHESQECTNRPDHSGQRPVKDGMYLLAIHGYAGGRNHVAEVGNVRPAKLALRTLDEELILLQVRQSPRDLPPAPQKNGEATCVPHHFGKIMVSSSFRSCLSQKVIALYCSLYAISIAHKSPSPLHTADLSAIRIRAKKKQQARRAAQEALAEAPCLHLRARAPPG